MVADEAVEARPDEAALAPVVAAPEVVAPPVVAADRPPLDECPVAPAVAPEAPEVEVCVPVATPEVPGAPQARKAAVNEPQRRPLSRCRLAPRAMRSAAAKCEKPNTARGTLLGSALVWLAAIAALAVTSAAGDLSLAGLSPPQRRMLDPLRERLLRPESLLDSLHLRGDEQVADVGAGPGFFTLRLARRVAHGQVIATDVDRAALEAVRERAAEAGLRNVETRQGAADAPGLAADSVDLVFLCQVDQALGDRVAYFRALREALRPRGRLVLLNLAAYREQDRVAAVEAGFRAAAEAKAPPGYFMLICDR